MPLADSVVQFYKDYKSGCVVAVGAFVLIVILSYLAISRQMKIGALKGELDKRNKKIKALQEESTNNTMLCYDFSRKTNTIIRCNMSICDTTQEDAPPKTIYAPSINTTWYPKDCFLEKHVMPERPVCKTKKCKYVMSIQRAHPDCPGQFQFCCRCEGINPDYSNAFDGDCTANYTLCEKL